MYLSVLTKEEKELFLGLAFELAMSDGNYSDEEKETIAGYCQEMQIKFEQNRMVKPIEEIIGQLKSVASNRIKKIVVFELIGLAMADGNFDSNERKIVNKMVDEFSLKSNFAEECEKVLSEYISFQLRINKLVLE